VRVRVRACRRLICFEPFSPADAIVVSRYNETRHLRTQSAALSKLASVVAHTLEAMSVARIARRCHQPLHLVCCYKIFSPLPQPKRNLVRRQLLPANAVWRALPDEPAGVGVRGSVARAPLAAAAQGFDARQHRCDGGRHSRVAGAAEICSEKAIQRRDLRWCVCCSLALRLRC